MPPAPSTSRAVLDGLTAAEVTERIRAGRSNRTSGRHDRTTGQIIRANVLTPVNAIIITLFALILISGHPQDGLFVGVVVCNSVIGILQELTARRELAKLTLLNAPRASVVRDGQESEIAAEEVVADDLIVLRAGDQLVVDAEIVTSDGLEIDESLLTGESDPVAKQPGDEAMSGSFVAAGFGRCVATGIGDDSYAARLADEARQLKLIDSELRRAIDTILRWLVPIIPVAAGLLFLRLLGNENWRDALQGTVAAAVAMVPDGLVLLTSLAFVAGVIALARQRALVKQLATVEVLARVDTLCLDKTGTITTGELSLDHVESLDPDEDAAIRTALAATVGADEAPNATARAIATTLDASPGWEVLATEPFSSARKWSSVTFAEHGTYVLGAPDMLIDGGSEVADRVDALTGEGSRVLLFCSSPERIVDQRLPADLAPRAVIVLRDTPRPDAAEILRYFHDQDVEIKVISGDNVGTVAAVADSVGLHQRGAGTDARHLPTETPELAEALDADTVFGRVAPEQKQGMVEALQSRGHVVGMTGDGVNDVLALREADLGIAMGSGSPASRSVADLVLLDNRFATLPLVVEQGRKVINNVERVANLFVVKAGYAVLLTALVGIWGVPFPFLPRQLTLIGSFSIGIPGFFLALAPETHLIRPGFLERVLRFSIPCSIACAVAAFVSYEYARDHTGIDLDEARTVATITLLAIGLAVLVVASRPIRPWKVGLALAMAASYVGIAAVPVLREFFELDFTSTVEPWIAAAVCVAAASAVVMATPRMMRLDDGHGPDAPVPAASG